jgi:hypothetical protein
VEAARPSPPIKKDGLPSFIDDQWQFMELPKHFLDGDAFYKDLLVVEESKSLFLFRMDPQEV